MVKPETTEADRLRDAVALLPRLHGAASRLQTFIDAGGVVKDLGPAQGHRARLFGFSSTGTGGPEQAVNNWMAQVERKAEIF